MEPLLKIRHLKKEFKVGKQTFTALHDLTLDIYPGEIVGLVGESGCGKSTAGRTLLRLYEPTAGQVLFEGVDLFKLSTKEMKKMRRRMQMIFQDPYASLDPRMTVQEILSEPLEIHGLAKGAQRKERVSQLLHYVGLNESHLSRFPHEFSGGQRQRIGIARALAVEPSFIVCDEPISALDVSIQAQVVNLLKKLQTQMHLTYLFIAHDLSMIKYISDRVAVMYLGHLMELAPTTELYQDPKHPYTQALLSSIPIPDPDIERQRERVELKGEVPSRFARVEGCPFRHRCPIAQPLCYEQTPSWREIQKDHFAACHFL